MPQEIPQNSRKLRPTAVSLLAVVVIIAAAWLVLHLSRNHRAENPKIAAMQPATLPTSRPVTQPLGEAELPDGPPALPPPASPPRTILDLVRAEHPQYPATQPLVAPLPLEEAARLVVKEPVYLDERGDLWITRADANPTEDVLRRATGGTATSEPRPRVHFVREPVAFVFWDDRAQPAKPLLICSDGEKSWLIDGNNRLEIPGPNHPATSPSTAPAAAAAGSEYDWSRAVSWNAKYLLVPTRAGVCLFTLAAPNMAPNPSPAMLAGGDLPAVSRTQYVFDFQGITAWIPPQGDQVGGSCAVRFTLKDGWKALTTDDGWPLNLLTVVPLMDGSALQVSLDPEGTGILGGHDERLVKFGYATLEKFANTDALKPKIAPLITQLSDDDIDVRDRALAELRQYGPRIWPILRETLKNPDSEEAAVRMRLLLRDQEMPSLAGMTLKDGKLRVAWHCRDGGVIFYAGGGVDIPQPDADPVEIIPAYISIRPSRPIELLPPALVKQLDVDHSHLDTWRDEIIVGDNEKGAQRFVGNDVAPLVSRQEHAFDHLGGIDNSGRWLLRDKAGATLVIDPYLPDPTPRLPLWILNEKAAGWDKHNWPCVQSEMIDQPAIIDDSGWSRPQDDQLINDPQHIPADTPATGPATRPNLFARLGPATAPATTSAASQPAPVPLQAGETALFTDAYGNRYLGGVSSITLVRRNGTRIDWPLPATAAGTWAANDVRLIGLPDNRLFLFNAPGRVVRLRLQHPSDADPSPLAVEAIFTHRIPNAEHPIRIWLDPAGRIDMLYDVDGLAILFPTGHIPRPIADIMPQDQQEAPGEGQ